MRKMILSILCPWTYEEMTDLPPDKITYIPHPDPTPGSNKIWDIWRSSPLWRSSRCIGINYQEEFKKHGYDLNDYERRNTYTLTGRSWGALKSDIDLNYQDQARYEIWGKVPERSDKEVSVIEFKNKKNQSSLLVVNIPMNSFETEVLPCKSLGTHEIEAPNQAAIDYYISSGYFITEESEWQEIIDGLPVPKEVMEFKFKKGLTLGRWEGVTYDDSEPRPVSPWISKLENLKSEVNKVLKKKLCVPIKGKIINSIIKKYYANF